MNCAWKELLLILPQKFRQPVDVQGRETLQELRLRLNCKPMLIQHGGRTEISGTVNAEDLHFVVNAASRYSPWAASTVTNGYITAQGGHRIGICGEAVMKDGGMTGIRDVRSVNIRVARDYVGNATELSKIEGNLLILGRPGSGKTTLLRDLIRQLSCQETVSVVDERGELFPPGLIHFPAVDILTGCPKPHGIETLLRTMGPDTIAVDEITAATDCEALLQAAFCGVRLIATAHASSVSDLHNRKVYAPIVKSGLFQTTAVMQADKTYRIERMAI